MADSNSPTDIEVRLAGEDPEANAADLRSLPTTAAMQSAFLR